MKLGLGVSLDRQQGGLKAGTLSYVDNNIAIIQDIAITSITAGVSFAGPYTFTGSLPAGLSLNSTTGAITGTPTAKTAEATYTITCKSATHKATYGLVLRVKDPIAEGLIMAIDFSVAGTGEPHFDTSGYGNHLQDTSSPSFVKFETGSKSNVSDSDKLWTNKTLSPALYPATGEDFACIIQGYFDHVDDIPPETGLNPLFSLFEAASGERGYMIYYPANVAELRALISEDGETGTQQTITSAAAPTSSADDSFIAGIKFDPVADDFRFYLKGVLEGTATLTENMFRPANQEFRVGQTTGSSSNNQGRLVFVFEKLAIWNISKSNADLLSYTTTFPDVL